MTKLYIDVTRKWIKKASQRTGSVKDMNYWIIDGKIYLVDGKNVVLDYSNEEKEVALWLVKTFGGEVFMCPRVNNPDHIKTPDYIWNGKRWDLKSIRKPKGDRAIDNVIKRAKGQSENFIIDISECILNKNGIKKQIKNEFNIPGREWLKIIVLKSDDQVIAVFKRIK